MINRGTYVLTLNYEFYGPRSRYLQHNNHIPTINYFGLILDYRNIQKWLVLTVVGDKLNPKTLKILTKHKEILEM